MRIIVSTKVEPDLGNPIINICLELLKLVTFIEYKILFY